MKPLILIILLYLRVGFEPGFVTDSKFPMSTGLVVLVSGKSVGVAEVARDTQNFLLQHHWITFQNVVFVSKTPVHSDTTYASGKSPPQLVLDAWNPLI